MACKSGIVPDPRCLWCEEVETMEHPLYGCENYSAKSWYLLGRSMTLVISRRTEEYIPSIVLTPIETVFNKHHHPSILIYCISKMLPLEMFWFSSFKKSNETSSSVMLSSSHQEEKGNCILAFKRTLSRWLTRYCSVSAWVLGCSTVFRLTSPSVSYHTSCPSYSLIIHICSLSLWRVVRGSKLMHLDHLIHGLFIT